MADPIVNVVDDDASVRKSLTMLLKSVGLKAKTYASAQEFLDTFERGVPGCLVLDVRMPGMSGVELQQKLLSMNVHLPIIFITAHGDVPMAVETMKAGAIDFIQKPFRDQDLIDRIQTALAEDERLRKLSANRAEIEERQETLTPREREVMDLVVGGAPNKAIAAELGLSERTVEIHRSRVMTKMGAESLAHLVTLVVASRGAGE